ncbi:flagellar hook assembly protein FlgD [Kordiimonas pumila]|uniref:Basal-body rod modification protein FlgD n=1 Tax=Kordiimonas pumila TaxID=2161677 RepID=A0ABV7D701_9PROT|nr:flagellar hook capping FlgD N-terminal domain-containing protein [Kordiimonas pumila]
MADVSSVTNNSAATTTAQKDSAALATDFSDFLTLLTTQLQYQDPLDPMDSGEFTNQLVAFAGVEQQIKANENLESIALLTSLNSAGAAVGYLGHTALVESPFGEHSTTGVNWQYSNTDIIEEITIQVKDEDGKVVYETTGETGLGLHDFKWDGLKTDGTLADAGTYELSITATDPEGEKVSPNIAVEGRVTAVDTSGLEPYFTIGPNLVAQSDIVRLLAQN